MPTHALSNDKLYDRVLIWRTAKERPELTVMQLSELLNKPEWTIRRVLKLREITPKEMLQALENEAVSAWRQALPIAGAKGDHRPAKDLLLHTRAIQPVADAGVAGITIQIGVLSLPGVSRAERDCIDVIPNELSDSVASVAAAYEDTDTGVPDAPTVAPGAPPAGPAKD